MISIINNRHVLSMENNENVLKRNNNNMKIVSKLAKRGDDVRPTILAKPHSIKLNDDSTSSLLSKDHEKQVKLITTNLKKESNISSTTNGHVTNGHKVLFNANSHHSSEKLINKQSPQSQVTVLTQQNSNVQTAAVVTPTNGLTSLNNGVNATSNSTQPAVTAISNQMPPLNVRLNTGALLNSSVKLLDENLVWQDQFQDYLLDQTDYLVVGMLGKQGVGKSTLLSLLAGNKFTDENRNLIFKPSCKDTRESSQHKTNGIQAFITAERTILLDVQPVLGSSVLEKAINYEKKHLNHDCKYYENFVELQSIELVCFLLTVCNVILVAEDWFTDPNIFKLLQTAEMLKPNMPNNNVTQDEFIEHHPHMVYLLNKSEFISKNDTIKMKKCIDNMMRNSKLNYKGSLAEYRKHLNHRRRLNDENINFIVIPKADGYKHDSHNNNLVPEFGGLSSFERCIKYLQREILGVKRNHFTSNAATFTEKKWFNYANKVWESIRKSSLIGEYNRLMT